MKTTLIFGLMAILLLSAANADLKDEMIACYTFDTNKSLNTSYLLDSTENSHNLIHTTNFGDENLFSEDAKFGQSVNFSLSPGNYRQFQTENAINNNPSNFTIAFWEKPYFAGTDPRPTFFAWGVEDSLSPYIYFLHRGFSNIDWGGTLGDLRFDIDNLTGVWVNGSSSPQRFHHYPDYVPYTLDNGEWHSIIIDTQNNAGDLSGEKIRIGNENGLDGSTNPDFRQRLDNFAIWNRSLTSTEKLEWYNNGIGISCDSILQCLPNYECTAYSSCSNNQKTCIQAGESESQNYIGETCGIIYSGDFSEFATQECLGIESSLTESGTGMAVFLDNVRSPLIKTIAIFGIIAGILGLGFVLINLMINHMNKIQR